MQIPEQYNYTVAKDAEITWNLLFPCEPLCNLSAALPLRGTSCITKKERTYTGCH